MGIRRGANWADNLAEVMLWAADVGKLAADSRGVVLNPYSVSVRTIKGDTT